MKLFWHCSCGEDFGEDAHAAFLHRQGDAHLVTPVLIERESVQPLTIHSFYRPQPPARLQTTVVR